MPNKAPQMEVKKRFNVVQNQGDGLFPIAGRYSLDDLVRLLDDLNNPWKNYIPTFTNLTVGNGTLEARYKRIGKMVDLYVVFVLGSTSSISGSVSFTLPVKAVDNLGQTDQGQVNMQDTGTNNFKGSLVISGDTAVVRRYVVSGSNIIGGSIDATNPFTWVSTDVLACRARYQAANIAYQYGTN